MDETFRSQFRLPFPLYERLKHSADKSRRSVNAELVSRLAESFQSPRELEDKLAVMKFVLQLSTKHIADQDVVASIESVLKSLAKYKDGEEFDQAGQKAFDRLVHGAPEDATPKSRPTKKPT